MKIIKNFTLLALSMFLIAVGASAQAKKKKPVRKAPAKTTKPVVKPVNEKTMPVPNSDYKVLVEGVYSKVETPFVFVARDAETYALIRSLVEGLPASSTVDFGKMAVVAAFAGEKNSGGYAVTIRPAAGKTIIDIRTPPKGGMTTQAITTPFQVALVPILDIEALPLDMTATWTSRMENYRVSKGDFEYSGGIAGRTKKFSAIGTVGVLRHGDHVTYHFNLSGKGGDQAMKLSEMASGVVNAGNVEIARLDAGSFAEAPRSALKVLGTVSGNKLLLSFEPHPPTVADGFAARGKLEAVRIK